MDKKRATMLPYARQCIDEDDIAAVVKVLRSDWLTGGPAVAKFERVFADTVGAAAAVAVSSGTAALHAALAALDIGPGDEVIVSPLTFVASVNCILYQGATPVFADVEPDTLLMDPWCVPEKITDRTKAIIAVDYAGQPCDYGDLRLIARFYNIVLVADACHSLGGWYRIRPVGTLADLTAFSFHPVKMITTGEGGMVTTNDVTLAEKVRRFRNHGLTTEAHQRTSYGYTMKTLGYNYRLTDVQCALGLSQLRKLSTFLARRRAIAARYDDAFAQMLEVVPLTMRSDRRSARHLYPIQLRTQYRDIAYAALRAENIGVNVHYRPVHLQPYYQERFHTGAGLCPVAEAAYSRLLTLPLYPGMTDEDVEDVIAAVRNICG